MIKNNTNTSATAPVYPYKIGFIGTGNMAEAMLRGILSHSFVKREELIGSDPSEAGRTKISSTYGITVTANNLEVVQQSEVIILAVKPQYYQTVIDEIHDSIQKEQLIVSIAPGKTLDWLAERFPEGSKLIRTMPNMPAMTGEGMTAVCVNPQVTPQEQEYVQALLQCFGQAEYISEGLMDGVVAVSGSSPAYIFMIIEAMADAAVLQGIPRAQAYRFAAQSVYGSAKMVLDTGKHPGELKDMICSPGGTTIEAVRVLEQHGLRSTIMEAMKACADKSASL